MQSRTLSETRRVEASAAVRRTAILAFAGCLALLALALPVNLGTTGFIMEAAIAAGDNSTAVGAGAAVSEPGDPSDDSTAVPATEQGSSTPNVIKEIGGVTGDTELSSQEEIEAIQSGWGTWRTADGPGSVMAQ